MERLRWLQNPHLEGKREASRSSWRGCWSKMSIIASLVLPEKLLHHKLGCMEQGVMCMVPAFMQPQVKMLVERESKGLFIGSVDQRTLLLSPRAAGNASQCLI